MAKRKSRARSETGSEQQADSNPPKASRTRTRHAIGDGGHHFTDPGSLGALGHAFRGLAEAWADHEWLVGVAAEANLPEPTAKLSSTGKSWILKSRGNQIGKLKAPHVSARRDDLVRNVCLLTYVITAELVMPLPVGTSWDEAAAPLWAARELVPAGMNHASVELLLAQRQGRKASPTALVHEGVAGAQAEAAAKLPKLEKQVAAAEKRDADDLKKLRSRLLKQERLAHLRLASSVTDAMQTDVTSALAKWQKSQRSERFPHRKETQPIRLRDGSWKIAEHAYQDKDGNDRHGFTVSFRLDGEMKGHSHVFAARVRGATHESAIKRALKEPSAKFGDARVQWDERRRSWLFRMTISVPRPEPHRGDGVMAVRVTMRDVLMGLDTDGKSHFFASTPSVVQTKEGFTARKADLRRSQRQPSTGKAGHGSKRRYREYRKLLDSEARWSKSFAEQIGAKVAKDALNGGVVRVVIAEMTKPLPGGLLDNLDATNPRFARMLRRFPLGMVRAQIVRSLDKVGIASVVVKDSYDAKTCPECGHEDAANHDVARRIFECTNEECDLTLHADFVAAWNMLRAEEVPDGKIRRVAKSISSALQKLRDKKPPVAAE